MIVPPGRNGSVVLLDFSTVHSPTRVFSIVQVTSSFGTSVSVVFSVRFAGRLVPVFTHVQSDAVQSDSSIPSPTSSSPSV